MNNMIRETQNVRYQVKVNGITLNESVSKTLAEQFISTLLPEQRNQAIIVPVTDQGSQVLFG